jgi:hypothetical protein
VPLARLAPAELERAERGFAVEGRRAILKARARELRTG